jgi:hypothetical protein
MVALKLTENLCMGRWDTDYKSEKRSKVIKKWDSITNENIAVLGHWISLT